MVCADVDECILSPCDTNAACSNNNGAFVCTCNSGYTGDGLTCSDVDECSSMPCDLHATCTNEPGGYSCACDSGYTGKGITCFDIDECATSPCNMNASCTNVPGFLFNFHLNILTIIFIILSEGVNNKEHRNDSFGYKYTLF